MRSQILTINGGSSSLKFALYNASGSMEVISGGEIAPIGVTGSTLTVTGPALEDSFSRPVAAPDHHAALNALFAWLEERGDRNAWTAAGHRVVHGGPKYAKSQLVSPEML